VKCNDKCTGPYSMGGSWGEEKEGEGIAQGKKSCIIPQPISITKREPSAAQRGWEEQNRTLGFNGGGDSGDTF